MYLEVNNENWVRLRNNQKEFKVTNGTVSEFIITAVEVKELDRLTQQVIDDNLNWVTAGFKLYFPRSQQYSIALIDVKNPNRKIDLLSGRILDETDS